MDNLTYKAAELFRKQCREAGTVAEPIGERSGPADALGGHFIVLRGDGGAILAVYKALAGRLQMVKQPNWPAGID